MTILKTAARETTVGYDVIIANLELRTLFSIFHLISNPVLIE